MRLSKSEKGIIMIIVAGCLWGTVGSMVKLLNKYHISSKAIVFWRVFLAFIILYLYTYFTNKDLLKIDKKGLLHTALMGFICQSIFNTLYFNAIEKTTIATAVVLLYTSPVFIIVISKILYNESFTKYKAFSLIACILGCYLTVTGGDFGSLKFNVIGIVNGIGAGLTYGLYTIFSKGTIKKYNQRTITIYMLGFGSIFILFISKPSQIFLIDYGISISSIFLYLAIFTTIMPYTLYSTGLSYGVESSKAGIIATIEVVMAVAISYIFFNESMIAWKLIGILMVLLSVLIVRLDNTKSKIYEDTIENKTVTSKYP